MRTKTGMLTVLGRMAPGSFIPLHIHTDIEQTYVLEGSLEDEQGAVTAGNFVWRPGGNTHLARAPNGCLSISFFTKPNKFFDDVPWFNDLAKEKSKTRSDLPSDTRDFRRGCLHVRLLLGAGRSSRQSRRLAPPPVGADLIAPPPCVPRAPLWVPGIPPLGAATLAAAL